MGLRRLLVLLVLAGIAAGCVFSSPDASPAEQEWIDVHVHLIGLGAGVRDFPGAARAAIAAMDDAGIRSSIVLPPPQTFDIRRPFDLSDFADALKSYPRRFAFLGGGGTLNRMLASALADVAPAPALAAEFERAAKGILAAGASGFGEIAAHHLSLAPGHPYQWVAPDHPLLLLLSDIAARSDALIDLHLDLVLRDIETPQRLAAANNPPILRSNIAGFERLLAHNRKARIVWAHAGSDPLGQRTAALSRALLAKHSNLYMSLRFPAGLARGVPGAQFAMDGERRPDPEWLRLVVEFPDRFVLGGDQFFPAPGIERSGPGLLFAWRSPEQRAMTRVFLESLPKDVACKIAIENPVRLYRLPQRPVCGPRGADLH